MSHLSLIPNSQNLIYFALFLYFYYFIGGTLEREWGAGASRFNYLSGVVLNIAYGFLVWLVTGTDLMITATYLKSFPVLCLRYAFPGHKGTSFLHNTIKIKWLAYLDAAFFLYTVVAGWGLFPANLLPLVAIINYLVFCGEDIFRGLRTLKRRVSPNVVNFRRAVRQSESGQKPGTILTNARYAEGRTRTTPSLNSAIAPNARDTTVSARTI